MNLYIKTKSFDIKYKYNFTKNNSGHTEDREDKIIIFGESLKYLYSKNGNEYFNDTTFKLIQKILLPYNLLTISAKFKIMNL